MWDRQQLMPKGAFRPISLNKSKIHYLLLTQHVIKQTKKLNNWHEAHTRLKSPILISQKYKKMYRSDKKVQ